MAAVSRLTRQLSDERASVLAGEAIDLARSGRLDVSFAPTPNLRDGAIC